ncbi:MAG: hypothetical protein VKL42_00915 [Snowella sp.]|nr:hypothetical protein [Snowella sp.]
MNTHGLETRGADVTVDENLSPPGSELRVLYRADWTDEQLKQPPTEETVIVQHSETDGRAYISLSLPAAGMVILG